MRPPSSLSFSLSLIAMVAFAACTKGGSPGDDDDAGAGADGADNDAGNADNAPPADAADDTTDPGDGAPPGATCAAGEKKGASGRTDGHKTSGGLGFNVRTPTDYDPTIGRPFIAVFAPASLTATETESFTALTTPALARGYIIAYADHRSPSSEATLKLGQTMVDAVAADYCVDTHRIYLAGHSDGATIASGISIYLNPTLHPAAVGPSAPGLNVTLAEVPMQFPFGSFVVQSKDDATFPGKGRKLAETTAKQAGCDPTPVAAMPTGCISWTGCMPNEDVWYCEGTGAHGIFQKKFTPAMLDFFDAHVRP